MVIAEEQPQNTFGRRDVGALLGNSFVIYWRNLLKLAAITLITIVPPLGLMIALIFLEDLYPPLTPPTGYGFSDDTAWIVIFVCLYLLMGLGVMLMNAAVIHAVSQQELIRDVSFNRAFSGVFRRFWALLGASVLKWLPLLLLYFSLIGIPAFVYLLIRWSFVETAVVVERSGIMASFRRSSQLVKQKWWWTFGLQLLWSVIVGSISGAILGIAYLVFFIQIFTDTGYGSGAVMYGIGVTTFGILFVFTLLLYPLRIVLPTLLFFDLRARREEFTPEMLAEDIGMTEEYREYRALGVQQGGA